MFDRNFNNVYVMTGIMNKVVHRLEFKLPNSIKYVEI